MITQRGRTLKADWVAFHNKTRHGLASGNVVVVDGTDTLYGDFLQFNVDTLQGVVYTGTLTNTETGFRMEGEEVRKTGEETYVFHEGVFTTCQCPEEGRDPWSISAKKADLELGGYAVTRNTSFDILGVPVIWLPYFVFPLKNERQTGFLFPSYALNSRSGSQVGLPFFWAARDNVNVLLTPTWTSRRGLMGKGELEYVMGERDFGEVFGLWLPSDDEVNPDDPDTPYDDQRWGVVFEHSQELPWELRLQARGVFVSDNDIPFDINEFAGFRRDRFLESTAFLTRHFGEFGSLGAFAGARWADDVQSPDDQDRDDFLLQRLPEVGFSQLSQPLPGVLSRLVTSFDARYANFWHQEDPLDVLSGATRVDELFLDTGIDALPDGLERNEDGAIVTLDGRAIARDGTVTTAAEVLASDPTLDPVAVADRFVVDQNNDDAPGGPEGDGLFQEGEPLADHGQRLLLNPRIALPFHLGEALEVYPELGYHGTFYQTDLQSTAERSLLTGRIDVRSRFTRTLELPRAGATEHVLEPRLTYYGVAELSDDDGNPLLVPATALPQQRLRQLEVDSILRDPADRIPHGHGVVLGVANRFYRLVAEPEVPPEPPEEGEEPPLFVPTEILGDLTASLEYRFNGSEFGWFVLDGAIYPGLRTRLRGNFGYDLDRTEIGEGMLEFGWSHELGHDLRFRYRYVRDIPQFFEDFRASQDRFDEFEREFDRLNQVEIGGRWAITPSWAVTYDLRYSFEQSLVLTNRGGIEYISRCKCWAIRAIVAEDRSRGVEFALQYALIGLGDDTVRPFD